MIRSPRLRALATVFALAVSAAAAPAFANDSEAEWALGGLTLKSNADISMDKEELFLSVDEVRVDYVYTNHSPEDREVLIAFPLPAQPDAEFYYDYYAYPDYDELDFSTTVDGEPVDFDIADRAIAGGRDVTDEIAALGWPLYWFRDWNFQESLADLDDAEKRRLMGLGLLKGDDSDGVLRVDPAWQVQRSVVRTQVFPAKSSVSVSHRYHPLTGGSVGGLLDPVFRKNNPEMLQEYVDKWCVDQSFLAGVDKRLGAGTEDNPVYYGETWLGYVLSSGANWAGPIKDFRLVVDKGATDKLVSFCMDGVKKIGPTRFEVVKKDFEPASDLNILILDFYRPNEEF